MSIELMTQVWKHSKQKGSALLMLLAIADYADDTDCAWPSVQTLADKTRMTRRNVQLLLRSLAESGELSIEGTRPNGVTIYRVRPPQLADRGAAPRRGAKSLRPSENFSPVKSSAQGGEIQRAKGVKPASPDPSLEPSVDPSVVSERARDADDAPTPTLHPDLRAALERAGVIFNPGDLATAASWAQLVPLSWQLDAVARAVQAGKPFIAYIHAIVQERHAQGRAPEPAQEQPLPADPDLVAAVCRAVGYDARTLPRKRRDQLHAAAATLAAAAYTPADVDTFAADVWPTDWRWTQKKSLPTLDQLLEEIGKVRKHGPVRPDARPHPPTDDDPRRALLAAKKRERAARTAAAGTAGAQPAAQPPVPDDPPPAAAGLPALQGPGLDRARPAPDRPALRPGSALPGLPPGSHSGHAPRALAAD